MSFSTSLKAAPVAGLLSLAAAGAAFAHAHLTAATPADHAVLAAPPAKLQLTFSEGVDLKFTGVAVSGPGDAAVATGAAALAAGGDVTLDVPMSGPLAPGKYTVSWHALSKDGHKTKGSYSFTVKP